MLIFNEEKHYDNLVANGFEKYPNKRDLLILCNGWIKNGTRVEFLKEKMVDFCINWNTQFNYAKSEPLLLSVLDEINKSEDEKPSWNFVQNITIYKDEVCAIKKIDDEKVQRILFVIICLAKWRNANFIYLNSGSSIKLSDICELAQLKLTKKEQLEVLHTLNARGELDVQLKPLLKTFVTCIQTEGIPVETFNIDSDLVKKLDDCKQPHCERCGKIFIKNNNKQKYCDDCARIVANEQKNAYRERLRKIEN